MEIVNTPISQITPYKNNPRINDQAVDAVANSIKEFGWQQPIVCDIKGVIIAGHTRYKAAIKLGFVEVPVYTAKDLTPAQVKAYRIADNQTASIADWDNDILPEEIKGLECIDLTVLGFDAEELKAIMNKPQFKPVDIDPPRLDEKAPKVCPRCGHEF